MKRIEDIEQMNLDDFERIARDDEVVEPTTLKPKIENTIMALSMSAKSKRYKNKHIYYYIGSGLLAAAASVAAFIIISSSQPKDTFDDPQMAYAELQKTFAFISSKMNDGISKMNEVQKNIELSNNLINNINNK